MSGNQIKMRGMARMAFRAVRNDVTAEIEAGSTLKLSWLKHFGDAATPAVSYTHFAGLVAREITGKAGSRGGPVPGKPTSARHSPQTDAAAPISPSEQGVNHGSNQYQPRKFTDFGNLESTLDRWYPPKEPNQLPDAAPSPQLNPQTIQSSEKQEQPSRNASQPVERPKRIVTRVPDIERLVFGDKGRPKE